MNIRIPCMDRGKVQKTVGWNINAPEEKWKKFSEELENRYERATRIITDKATDIDQRYSKWFNEIDNAARKSIGKTTFKVRNGIKPSKESKEVRLKKKELNHEIRKENCPEKRETLIMQHKDLQEKARQIMINEKAEDIDKKLQRIINDTTGKTFWGVIKTMKRDPILEHLAVKDANGQRQFTPEGTKEAHVCYYQALYKNRDYQWHPYHDEVEMKMELYSNDRNHEDTRYNQEPSIEEIAEIIKCKKKMVNRPLTLKMKCLRDLVKL